MTVFPHESGQTWWRLIDRLRLLSKLVPPASETLHTTTEHPFLTQKLGWVNAQDLHTGLHVRTLTGTLGVVVGTYMGDHIDHRHFPNTKR